MLDTQPRTLKTERELYKRSAVRSPTQSCLLQERGGSVHTGPSTVDGQGGRCPEAPLTMSPFPSSTFSFIISSCRRCSGNIRVPLVDVSVRCRPVPSRLNCRRARGGDFRRNFRRAFLFLLLMIEERPEGGCVRRPLQPQPSPAFIYLFF